jgi:hypothetical protein
LGAGEALKSVRKRNNNDRLPLISLTLCRSLCAHACLVMPCIHCCNHPSLMKRHESTARISLHD